MKSPFLSSRISIVFMEIRISNSYLLESRSERETLISVGISPCSIQIDQGKPNVSTNDNLYCVPRPFTVASLILFLTLHPLLYFLYFDFLTPGSYHFPIFVHYHSKFSRTSP